MFLSFLSILFVGCIIGCIIALLIKYNTQIQYNSIIIILLVLLFIFIVYTTYIIPTKKQNDINKKNAIVNIKNIKNISDLHTYLENINDDNYSIIEIDNVLSSSECDDLILYADKQSYFKSQVLTSKGSIDSSNRESQQCWLRDNSHIHCNKISAGASKITKLPIENMEELQIVKYEKGGYFKEHYDPEVRNKSNINDRIYTLIIYLNDDFEGGETYFKKLDINVKPKKGKAVLFKSLKSDKTLLKKSLHQGQKVTSGIKYMCNKWIHIDRFNYV